MKVVAMVAASLFALSLSAQGFAQNANPTQDQDHSDRKPAAVIAPDQAESAAVGGISGAVVAGTVAVVVAAVAIGAGNGGSDHTDHGTGGTTGTTH